MIELLVGAARHFDLSGIEGFSTANCGWLAFGLVGGVGFAWRLAGRPAGWWLPARALLAPILTFVGVFAAMTAMTLIFLADQSLHEALTTDALGRAGWSSVVVAVLSGVVEVPRAAGRGARGLRRR